MKALKLGDRDYQLLAVMAEARCLSAEQLRRLFFRAGDESIMRRRMAKLAAGPRGLVKRVEWYERSGVKFAWCLTPAGYAEAERFTESPRDVPRDDIGAEFLDHHVLLTDLFVGLLAAPVDAAVAKLDARLGRQQIGRVFARGAHPGFRWLVVGDRDLPWKQPNAGQLEARVLRPDALFELLASRRRIFVESEIGTHTIVAVSASKTGATTSKMDRYESFCTLLSGPATRKTWYAERFSDGFKPEVLFLVRTALRATSVQRAVEAWRIAHPLAVCTFRVATVEQAVTSLLPQVSSATAPSPGASEKVAPPVPKSPGVLAAPDVKVLLNYFASAQADFKARRDRARASGAVPPAYPTNEREVYALLQRLRESA